MAKQCKDLTSNEKTNVNEFIFGNMKAEEKLEVIKNLGIAGVRRVSPATILRIINECKDDVGNFRIDILSRLKT